MFSKLIIYFFFFYFVFSIQEKVWAYSDSKMKESDSLLLLFQNKEYYKFEKGVYSISSLKAILIPFLQHLKGDYRLSNESFLAVNIDINSHLYQEMAMTIMTINCIQLGDYQKALTYWNQYAAILEKEGREVEEGYNNLRIILEAIKDFPAPYGELVEEDIQATKDRAGLFQLTVLVNQRFTEEFVFDTGANFSVITETNALKAGVEIAKDYKFKVKGISGKEVEARAGLAKEFSIGNSKFYHVVFLVFPDEALEIKQLYKINGIIGLPLIRQLQKITINQQNQFHVEKSVKQNELKSNLYSGLFQLSVGVEVDDSIHCLFLDLGAKKTSFNHTAMNSLYHPQLRTINYNESGMGGKVNRKAYQLDSISLLIEGQEIKLNEVTLFSEPINKPSGKYFGTLGCDIFKTCDAIRLDFVNHQFTVLRNQK